jgi:hypothetical protein
LRGFKDCLGTGGLRLGSSFLGIVGAGWGRFFIADFRGYFFTFCAETGRGFSSGALAGSILAVLRMGFRSLLREAI